MAKLEKIKLAGFKSFVDATTVDFPGSLIGVVGPNGCGKSNIIDAVRWVIGEKSAKQLRGTVTTDIIFNGSKHRKPVSQASVELVFDNADGSIGGEYAKYPHIAIKRVVDRTGQSIYFLNGTRCRRRDIVDLFLGTGLSPRSYAIVEQGLISRMIEAKPEDLRDYIEEAAGISRYKDRRHETELRIKHTKENINRINDLLEEIKQQLDKLNRQAKAAQRYKDLKEKERLLKAQLLGFRFLDLENKIQKLKESADQENTALTACQTDAQSIETEIEKQRVILREHQEALEEAQAAYYKAGGEVTRLEQAIEHHASQKKQLQNQIDQINCNLSEKNTTIQKDESEIETLKIALEETLEKIKTAEQDLEKAKTALQDRETHQQTLQKTFEELNAKIAAENQTIRIQETRTAHLNTQKTHIEERLQHISEEKKQLEAYLAQHKNEIAAGELNQLENAQKTEQEALQKTKEIITHLEKEQTELEALIDIRRAELQKLREQQVSLKTQQNIAMELDNNSLNHWLQSANLEKNSRVAQQIQVENGWERAVETVLRGSLIGICINALNEKIVKTLPDLKKAGVTLIELESNDEMQTLHPFRDFRGDKFSLYTKVKANAAISHFLQDVYIVDSLEEALSLRSLLKPHESFITKEGIQIGKYWLHITDQTGMKAGMVKREKELAEANDEIRRKGDDLAEQETKLTGNKKQLLEQKAQFTMQQHKITETYKAITELRAKLNFIERQNQLSEEKLAKLAGETEKQQIHTKTIDQEILEAAEILKNANEKIEKLMQEKETLSKQREVYQTELKTVKDRYQHYQEEKHTLQLAIQKSQLQIKNLSETIERNHQAITALASRQKNLQEEFKHTEAPELKLKQAMQTALSGHLDAEKTLADTQKSKEQSDESMQLFAEKGQQIQKKIQETKHRLDEKRLQTETLRTRQNTYQEQLADTSFSLKEITEELPNDKKENDYTEALEKIAGRVERMGPINLAAISEHEELSQRKTYLDKQLADLEEALHILHEAIQKIDRETRAQFKETFTQLNENFQSLFPRVFGGGQASLALNDDDLLTAGVELMAKPPGKNIRNVQLMSGGEKALVSIALVFSLFQLNPAPFCLLDEVDAPLDDLNVARYCELLKEISKHVQLVFISHNKNAIKTADHLMGITMNEPGVSRVVSIDMEKAMKLVENNDD